MLVEQHHKENLHLLKFSGIAKWQGIGFWFRYFRIRVQLPLLLMAAKEKHLMKQPNEAFVSGAE